MNKKTSKWDQGPKLKDQDDTLIARGKKKRIPNKSVEREKHVELKTELHLLAISEEAKKMILETLQFINGGEFSTKDLSSYKDRGVNLHNRYWVNRGNLVIKGVENYSLKVKKQPILLAHEKVKKFAMDKLEKYGFHKSHCSEALDASSGDVGAAYELLVARYFHVTNYKLTTTMANHKTEEEMEGDEIGCNKNNNDNRTEGHSPLAIGSVDVSVTEEDIISERQLEMETLKSIYDKSFEERIQNRLWVVNLELPYLIEHFNGVSNKFRTNKSNCDSFYDTDDKRNNNNRTWMSDKSRTNSSSNRSTSAEVCKFFLKGNCKFGDKCRHSHVINKTPGTGGDVSSAYSNCDDKSDLNNCICMIEIRFPVGCRYPFQDPALVSFYSLKSLLPAQVCLNLTEHLFQLMRKSVEIDSPCVYTLVDFMENHSKDVIAIAESKDLKFIDPSVPLIEEKLKITDDCDETTKNGDEESDMVIGSLRGGSVQNASVKSNSTELSDGVVEKLIKENDELCRRFRKKQKDTTYMKYLSNRKSLPAWSERKLLLETVSKNQVVIISGETGCGKSTQVGQFILDDWLMNRKDGSNSHVNIICTQPRRISALGVASRVAEERIEQVGDTVGYQIRLESCTSSKTRLLFCTTGIILRKLETDSHLKSVTHIIVDEVHERSEESDFLLLILKELMSVRKDLKLVLMSATMNDQLFSEYFNRIESNLSPPPLISIPGRTFPVEQLFLEDIMDLTNYVLEENSEWCRYTLSAKGGKTRITLPYDELETDLQTCDVQNEAMIEINEKIKDENLTLRQICIRYQDYTKQTCKNLYMMDQEKINFELIENILMWLAHGEHLYPKTGSILIFLPGLQEITSLHDRLRDTATFSPASGRFVLIPLHSSLTSEEQSLVFKRQKDGVRKIILTTNIAETSITIDDCVFVIDSGKMKEKRFDSDKNMESLDTVWVSRANALQRKGRAGRVMAGVCVHLYSSNRMNSQMLSRPVPEIHRVPLEQSIIRIKVLPIFIDRSVSEVFGAMLEPPLSVNVLSSLKRLEAVGALDKEDRLTPLGKHLGALPVDVRIGKLILYGAIFCCLDSVLTIAACLSYKTPFVSPFRNKDAADAKKREFAAAKSDQLTVLKAFNSWREMRLKSKSAGAIYASENFMSSHTLTTLVDIKKQFLQLLITIGFVSDSCQPMGKSSGKDSGIDKTLQLTGQELNANCTNDRLLVSILCAALYPNIVKVLTPQKYYAMSASGAVPKLPSADEIKFKTKSDGYVNLHPSSVNYNVCDYSSPYLVYQEKVRTSRVFIRECAMVPIIPLVLFSGSVLEVQLNNGTFVVSLEEGWIMFATESNEIAELLQALQIELFRLLEEKIQEPKLNLLSYEKGRKIITTIIYLVTRG